MEEYRLPPEEVTRLTEMDATIRAIQGALTKAERAGIDVTQLQADLADVQRKRRGLLAEYGPQADKRKRPGT